MIAEARIWDALRGVLDPELGINVVDLGLVYGVETTADADVRVVMTMTTQACPLHAWLTESAEQAIRTAVPEARSVIVTMVWEPPWTPAMVAPEARRLLGG